MDQIIFHSNYSWLWLLLFGAIAIFFSGLLYFTEKDLSGPSWLKALLGTLRCSIFFILLLLFIEPFLIQNSIRLEKPGFLILADNSASMLKHGEEDKVKSIEQKVAQIESKLSEKFRLYTHSFSAGLKDSLKQDYKGASTNIYQSLAAVKQRYYQEPIAGLLMISDGISNSGFDPSFVAEQFDFPIFTVGVGDSTQFPDLKVEELRYNDYSFLGNEFPVSLIINAVGLEEEVCKLEVKDANGSSVYTENITIDRDNFSLKHAFNLESNVIGLQYYDITVTTLSKEQNLANNTEVFGVEVIDSRKKLLLLSDGAHPDLGAIRQVLIDNNDLEIDLKTIQDISVIQSIKEYDLVWIYQPRNPDFSKWLTEIRKQKIPYIVHTGLNTDYNLINNSWSDISIKPRKNVVEDFSYSPNEGFNLFKLMDKGHQFFKASPPLRFPLATIQFAKESQVLAFQTIDGIPTDNPMVAFTTEEGVKVGWIFGEGAWKWKMNNYRQNGSFDHFSDMMDKFIQYLSVKKDKRRLRVKIPKKIIGNSAVNLLASYYNESFELDNSPEVSLELKGQNGKVYSYQFDQNSDAYKLKFSGLPEGKYDYTVKVNLPGDYTVSGSLLMIKNDIELFETRSNFKELVRLSALNDGSFFYLDQWEEMEKELMNVNEPKIRYDEQEKTFMQEMPWLLYLVLGLLFTEWFLRKYFGVL